MRVLILLAILSLSILPAAGQPPYSASVAVESAFLRAGPIESAEPAGSVYEGDLLTVIGRNADGAWLQVHRPPTPDRLAWVRRDLVSFTGNLTLLPLTDPVTGVTGPEPLSDTGIAALFTGEAQLRAAPDRFAASAGVVPIGAVAQVVERAPNNFWLKVNYLGTVGWVAEFTTSVGADFAAIPIAPELAEHPAYAPLEIIDPALQVEQIDRLLTYLVPAYETTSSVAHYWREIMRGETRECLPPADIEPYAVTSADLRVLPELRRQFRLLEQAVIDANRAIAAMHRCGVYITSEIRSAYSDAVAARGTLDLLIRRMRVLREQLTGEELDD